MRMFNHMNDDIDIVEKMNGSPLYGMWVAVTLPFRMLWWIFIK